MGKTPFANFGFLFLYFGVEITVSKATLVESGIFPDVALQKDTPLEKAFNEITKEIVSELLKRNANLPPTEVVRITTMSGCSAVKK